MRPETLSPIINDRSDVKHVQGIDRTDTITTKLTEVKTLGFEGIECFYDQFLGSNTLLNCFVGIV